MFPTFKNYQLLYVSKDLANLKPGQVVVFKNDNQILIKRIAKVYGDTYWVNFKSPAYYFITDSDKQKCEMFEKISIKCMEKRHILEDEVFVLGDNLENSIDSRVYGPIKKSSIIGCLETNDNL